MNEISQTAVGEVITVTVTEIVVVQSQRSKLRVRFEVITFSLADRGRGFLSSLFANRPIYTQACTVVNEQPFSAFTVSK